MDFSIICFSWGCNAEGVKVQMQEEAVCEEFVKMLFTKIRCLQMMPFVPRKGAVICVCGEGKSVLKCWVVAVMGQCAPLALQKCEIITPPFPHTAPPVSVSADVRKPMWRWISSPQLLPYVSLGYYSTAKPSSVMPSSGLGVPLHAFQIVWYSLQQRIKIFQRL